jgi:lysophospholipase L1-like esterase
MSDTTFLTYRTRSYEDAFPGALATLERTREVAASRGAVLAVLNIPRFTWNGVLTDASQYEYRGLNERLEAWCRVRGVPYFDALPLLIGKDIGGLRVSETDIHFAEMGHRVLGLGLVDFLASLTGAGDGRDDPSPESTRRRERSGS